MANGVVQTLNLNFFVTFGPQLIAEASSEPCPTSKMERLAVNYFRKTFYLR